MIVRVNVILNRLLLAVTDVSTISAVVIFRIKVSCIMSIDDNKLWLLILLVTVKQSFISVLSKTDCQNVSYCQQLSFTSLIL